MRRRLKRYEGFARSCCLILALVGSTGSTGCGSTSDLPAFGEGAKADAVNTVTNYLVTKDRPLELAIDPCDATHPHRRCDVTLEVYLVENHRVDKVLGAVTLERQVGSSKMTHQSLTTRKPALCVDKCSGVYTTIIEEGNLSSARKAITFDVKGLFPGRYWATVAAVDNPITVNARWSTRLAPGKAASYGIYGPVRVTNSRSKEMIQKGWEAACKGALTEMKKYVDLERVTIRPGSESCGTMVKRRDPNFTYSTYYFAHAEPGDARMTVEVFVPDEMLVNIKYDSFHVPYLADGRNFDTYHKRWQNACSEKLTALRTQFSESFLFGYCSDVDIEDTFPVHAFLMVPNPCMQQQGECTQVYRKQNAFVCPDGSTPQPRLCPGLPDDVQCCF